MRRSGVVCLLFALMVGTFVAHADAAKRKPRQVTREAAENYGMPWLSSPSTGTGCFGDGCVRFRVSESERWTTMAVSDESGTPTAFEITQRTDASGTETTRGPFCGSTGERPVELVPGADVFVYVYAFGDAACPGSFGTTGTVTAVFSNLP